MIYKVAILSTLVSLGIGLFAYALGWIESNTVIVMTTSGAVGGIVAFQSAKSHN